MMDDEQARLEVAKVAKSRWGMVFPETREHRLSQGLEALKSALGCGESQAVAKLRAGNPAAEEAFVQAVVIGETYFFRHPEHFSLLRRLLEDRRDRPRLRVWSAGCSTGEEAYSLAITALEELGPRAAKQVDVVATDLSPRALQRAREGRYRPWSFRGVSDHHRRAWFDESGGAFRVKTAPRELIRWRVLNLNAPEAVWPQHCDMIFIRNVLLYFDSQVIGAIADRLAESLADDGMIVTASTDPDLLPLSSRLCLDPILNTYRRVAGDQPRPSFPPAFSSDHELARALIDRGEVSAALAILERLLSSAPPCPGALALRALLRSTGVDTAAALSDAQRASELAPNLALAHWVAAQSFLRADDRTKALREVDKLLACLATMRHDELVPLGGGVTARGMREAARGLRERL